MGRLSAKRKDSDSFPPLTIELGVLLLRVVAGTATSERDEPGGKRHRAVCNYCGGKSTETHANASGVLDLPITHLEQDCPGKLAKDLWNREGLDILRAAVRLFAEQKVEQMKALLAAVSIPNKGKKN